MVGRLTRGPGIRVSNRLPSTTLPGPFGTVLMPPPATTPWTKSWRRVNRSRKPSRSVHRPVPSQPFLKPRCANGYQTGFFGNSLFLEHTASFAFRYPDRKPCTISHDGALLAHAPGFGTTSSHLTMAHGQKKPKKLLSGDPLTPSHQTPRIFRKRRGPPR